MTKNKLYIAYYMNYGDLKSSNFIGDSTKDLNKQLKKYLKYYEDIDIDLEDIDCISEVQNEIDSKGNEYIITVTKK